QPPFSFPAVAVEGDVVVFLEPEPAQGNQDENHNGQVFETILRVFRLVTGSPPSAVEITSDANPLTADGAPVINGRSVVVSNGRVFFRTPEAATALHHTERVSVASDGTPGNGNSLYPSISADGRFVAFESDATNLVAGDASGVVVVFVNDRLTGATERGSVASDRTQGNDTAVVGVDISADGRFVAFLSDATNLVAGDVNGAADVFVHD